MTTGWFFFGSVMPAIVAGGGWIMVLAPERSLKRPADQRTKAGE